MRYVWTPKFKLSGPTVRSYTVVVLRDFPVVLRDCLVVLSACLVILKHCLVVQRECLVVYTESFFSSTANLNVPYFNILSESSSKQGFCQHRGQSELSKIIIDGN